MRRANGDRAMQDIWISIAAFFAALVFLALSTVKWRLAVRLIIWLIGAALLAGAFVAVAHDPHYGLVRALADLVENLDAPQDSFIGMTLRRQMPIDIGHIGAWLDVAIVLAAVLALVALLAFTPGQTMERLVRAVGFGVGGAMIGALAMFALVTLGLDEDTKPRVFAGYIEPADVHDGDTLYVGEYPIRLFGIDTPELDQACLVPENAQCGELARDHLRCLVTEGGCVAPLETGEAESFGPRDERPALVHCEADLNSKGVPRDTFGRPLAVCYVHRAGRAPVNINARMVADGYAVRYRDQNLYAELANNARASAAGLMGYCWVEPSAARRMRKDDVVDASTPTIGTCASVAE